MKRLPCLLLALCGLAASPAFALNILLSNDDGYRHPNIRALYTALKAAGHHVKIAAPQSEQSARGGAFLYGREVTVGRDNDPAYPDSYYISTHETGLCSSEACAGQQVQIEISGTPVMALLMGLKKILPAPDLVIVGPNPGNNVGAINAASGTFNAASVAVRSGYPALAVSTDLKDKDPQRIAALVVKLVDALDRHRQPDGKLLPSGLGLNVNVPADSAIKGVRLTRIGSYVGFDPLYTDDLAPLFPALAGKPGISFQYSPPATSAQQDDEAVWLARGYLTISPFNGLLESTDLAGAAQALTALPLIPQEKQP
ncbi:5'/3'-nucleotidase SurE [Pseudomonas putida]|uniref:5'-nucleotidase n=1 Tax=Pseudomonas putida TaxID=303 RepID=A0A7W2L0L5_PSEPU|nr:MULTISPECIES: 5'/3'-nucleotidase SurE [Pseudomonas]MBA6116236.1 5'/3'-nucleotidase SurE [Pseudomonas putida]MBI6942748.1 5'/3'-nucleotidase SurE [Pseudomonas putida]MBI6958795.1 5'/3'-nucleotidase SurE [Pseudomonas putida]MCZ9639117.1 5'/3'-nucleotidase SurE [Pseudomonas putida]MEC4874941.1 5'/3'-nucleotidase SurE [Pseudomonas sp. NC26]